MANKRVLVKRRKSVRNIRKITRTMQLIATARFQAAFSRATQTKPYTEKLNELVANLSGAADNVEHPLMKTPEETKRTALVVITSDRGLCGGFNANVLRTAVAFLDEQHADGVQTDVYMAGRKGVGYFKFLNRDVTERIDSIGDKPRFDDIEPLANALMKRFVDGEIAAVRIAYMKFHSAGKQTPEIETVLPLSRDESTEPSEAKVSASADYEFSPEPQALLDELLPASVRVQMFQCFMDAIVSEQISRMVAMKAATDAAGDMIKALSRKYNRARQTQITMELLDIVGGANALA